MPFQAVDYFLESSILIVFWRVDLSEVEYFGKEIHKVVGTHSLLFLAVKFIQVKCLRLAFDPVVDCQFLST